MLKEDFKDETKTSQTEEKPYRTELEEKYANELKSYENKTHFLEAKENDFEDAPGSTVNVQGPAKEKSVKTASKPKHADYMKDVEASAPISAGEILGKGVEVVSEKAVEVWEDVKSEWKNDKQAFVRKSLIAAAVTGAAIGLILVSRRKKTKETIIERAMSAIS